MNALLTDFRAMLDEVCWWCPQCGWRDFGSQLAPASTCPWCDAPALPPPDIMETEGHPLLLEEGARELYLQVLDARFMGPRGNGLEPGPYNGDPVIACGIVTSGVREPINRFLRRFPRIGCYSVDNSPQRACIDGDMDEWTSYVLFAPLPHVARAAHRIARMLARTTPSVGAMLTSRDFCGDGIWLCLAPKHLVFLDGQRIDL